MSHVYGYHELDALIPEGRPLRMVDRLELDLDGRRGVGVKNVSMNEVFFLGHFPGAPIMPGVLQVAAMAQVGGALLRRLVPGAAERIPWCRALQRIRFRSPVYPGDRLLVTAQVTRQTAEGDYELETHAQVGETVASSGTVVLTLADTAALTPAPAALAPAVPVPDGTGGTPAAGILSIMSIIPHRFPFLLIDRLCYVSPAGDRCVGLKNVTGNEPYFAGLAVPAVPGWLQVETAAQVGCAVALAQPGNVGKLGVFMSIDQARFLAPVVPGDQLLVDLTSQSRGRFGKADAKLYVADRAVGEVSIKYAIVDRAPAADAPAATPVA